MKFELFATGIAIAPDAIDCLIAAQGDRPLTLADYASTSGITLALEDDVWVNAPTAAHNPNMVFAPRHELRADGEHLYIRNLHSGLELGARFVPVPAYENQCNAQGEPFTDFIHTHTDRARLSPIQGCAMHCKFCDVPAKLNSRFRLKPVDKLIEAVDAALKDPIQPAAHLLISGGTPGPNHFSYLKQAYHEILSHFASLPIDIMMAPLPEVLDLDELGSLGVNELSINVEIWDEEQSALYMTQKFRTGRAHYLDFLAAAVDRLGPGRVRSMLLVGLEDLASTLVGVEALARVGCTPVLSPFRPDPATELANTPAPNAETMMRIYMQASEIAAQYGVHLGPRCIPCSHNTITLATDPDYYAYASHRPNLIGH
jgi:hypothetical protein